jgi:hypothetical protein
MPYTNLPNGDLVPVATCKRDISEELLCIFSCAVRWINYRPINRLRGMWIALN